MDDDANKKKKKCGAFETIIIMTMRRTTTVPCCARTASSSTTTSMMESTKNPKQEDYERAVTILKNFHRFQTSFELHVITEDSDNDDDDDNEFFSSLSSSSSSRMMLSRTTRMDCLTSLLATTDPLSGTMARPLSNDDENENHGEEQWDFYDDESSLQV